MIALQIDEFKFYFANKKVLRNAMERYLKFTDPEEVNAPTERYSEFIRDNIMQYANSAINTKTNEVLKCRMPIETIFDAAAKQ